MVPYTRNMDRLARAIYWLCIVEGLSQENSSHGSANPSQVRTYHLPFLYLCASLPQLATKELSLSPYIGIRIIAEYWHSYCYLNHFLHSLRQNCKRCYVWNAGRLQCNTNIHCSLQIDRSNKSRSVCNWRVQCCWSSSVYFPNGGISIAWLVSLLSANSILYVSSWMASVQGVKENISLSWD